jgi:hypothetical protein
VTRINKEERKMARRARTAKMSERKLNVPGFSAEASLGPTVSRYRGRTVFVGSASKDGGRAMPQLGLGSLSGVDLGAYLRCRANGGGDLICRFFGGLPPFTIGGLLF